jgi:tRNA pseudouridine32 synthase / 23S rRNA pseudouridine746 synthase
VSVPRRQRTRNGRARATAPVSLPAVPPSLSAAEIEARLLHRDGLMLVIDKPAGLPVHAGPGGGPNLESAFVHLRYGLPNPPALAHRLDRDTSGCLVLGRHAKALRKLGRLFAAGRVGKTYWAVVDGEPEGDAGVIELALTKLNARAGGWRMAVAADGQAAVTAWRVRGRGGGRAWLELNPRTGRTHQIRVHCAAMGWPVAGDPLYGKPGGAPGALMLHSRAISVPMRDGQPPVAVEAPVPAHMRAALAALGWAGEG